MSGLLLYAMFSLNFGGFPNREFKSPIIQVGVCLKFDKSSCKVSIYSPEKYFVFDGGIYNATHITSIGTILKIIQSLKSRCEITTTSNSESIFLYKATPPLGVVDSIGVDLASSKKFSGHLLRMFRCVSEIATIS